MTGEHNCTGCFMEDISCDIRTVFIDKLIDSDICPCSICIVKVMCDTTCRDYLKFYGDLSERSNHKKAGKT